MRVKHRYNDQELVISDINRISLQESLAMRGLVAAMCEGTIFDECSLARPWRVWDEDDQRWYNADWEPRKARLWVY